MENGLPTICREKKSRNGFAPKLTIPASFLFRRHLYYCQNFPTLFQRSGVGSAHEKKQSIQCLICHAKKSKNVYKTFSHGYTINRKTDSTTLKSQSRQQNFTYLILIKKIYFPKTQDFLRPQECESISDSLSNSSAYFFAFEQCFFLAPIFVANFTHKHLLYYIAVFPQLKYKLY